MKNIFQSNSTSDKEKSPQIGIEIVGSSITYSRCEFDTCQITFDTNENQHESESDTNNDSTNDNNSTSIKHSNLVGDTCNWIFRENAEFSIDSKVTFQMNCTFNGYEKDIIWCGTLTISPMDIIDEVQSYILTPLPLDKYMNDDIFININEVVASISLRIYIPPLEKPIATVQVVVWQGKSINSKYSCSIQN